MNKIFVRIGVFTAIVSLTACTGGDSSPGYEYMPNMYRSPGIETYGEHNIEGYNGMPVEGTIARGKLSTFNYDKSEYLLAGDEANYPSSFTKDDNNLEEGKELFEMMCSHCHGNNGDGKGSIKHDIYSAVPSFFDANEEKKRRSGTTMSELKEGHIFHTITYGLNAMGPHASQITEEERWKIVYYIQEKLQNN